MKTPATLACLALLVGAFAAPPTMGQEPGSLDDVKAQLQKATELLRQQQAAIEVLQKKIADLEVKSQNPARQGAQDPPGAEVTARREARDSGGEAKGAPPPAVASWKDGTTTFRFPSAELKLTNRAQLRWTRTEPEGSRVSDAGAFSVRRFKVQLAGWAYTPDLTFRVQADLANANTALGILDDASVNYDFTRGKGIFQVTAGQFKIPFGRQALASTRTDMFVDRSFVTYLFSSIRDVGIMAHGQFGPSGVKDLIGYSVGVFNGAGRSVYKNPDGKYKTDLRLVVSPWGSAGYDEANPSGAAKAKLSLGLGYETNDTRERGDEGRFIAGTDHRTMGYDVLLKYRRFTAYGEYFDRTSNDKDAIRTDSEGLNAQVGFLVIPNRWEVFLGYWTFDTSRTRIAGWQRDVGIGTNLYFSGFNSKLQADLRRTRNESTTRGSTEFRLQYQIVF